MTTDSYRADGPYAPIESIADTPIELPTTVLGEVAELLREAQAKNMQRQPQDDVGYKAKLLINDKIGWALFLVDVERGDGI